MEYSTASLAALRPGVRWPWALLYGVHLRSSDDGFAYCTLGSAVPPQFSSFLGFLGFLGFLVASRLLRLWASQGFPYGKQSMLAACCAPVRLASQLITYLPPASEAVPHLFLRRSSTVLKQQR
jgi:hypothetical protein